MSQPQHAAATIVPVGDQATGEVNYLLYVDPLWSSSGEDDRPPVDRIVGAWEFDVEGGIGKFFANPDYAPATADSPTDPVDGVLREVVRGQVDGEEVLAMLGSVQYGIALEGDGNPLIIDAPDGVPSLVVTTAPWHRERVAQAADWIELGLPEMSIALPRSGVDVLLNPGGPASMRLLASAVREAARASLTGTPDEG